MIGTSILRRNPFNSFVMLLAILVLLLGLSGYSTSTRGFLPRTGSFPTGEWENEQAQTMLPSLSEFQAQVFNGDRTQVIGVWAEGLFAFQIEPKPGYSVPPTFNTAGIYSWAFKRGVTALMIHDYLGGDRLYDVGDGDAIALIHGDGSIMWYVVDVITRYEAQSYNQTSFQGPFRPWDCQQCAFDLDVANLQTEHYTGDPRLAFQTCLEEDGRAGLIIVEASPIEP